MGSLWRWWVSFRVCSCCVYDLYLPCSNCIIVWMHLSSLETPVVSWRFLQIQWTGVSCTNDLFRKVAFYFIFLYSLFKICIFIFVVCFILFKGCEVMPKVLNIQLRKVNELPSSIYLPFIVLVWKILLWYCHRVGFFFTLHAFLSQCKVYIVIQVDKQTSITTEFYTNRERQNWVLFSVFNCCTYVSVCFNFALKCLKHDICLKTCHEMTQRLIDLMFRDNAQ